METWFANHVLGLCLTVLLLALPGPLRAGTPSSNSTDSATTGFYSSAATDELSDMETNATSASYSSESLSPSQRNILLTHTAETHTAAAENFDSEQPQTVTETSSRSLEATNLSTEPLASTLVVATTDASSSSRSSGSSSSSISSSSNSSSSISSSSSSSSISSSSSSISSSSIRSSSISSSSSSSSISSSSSSIGSSSIGSSSSISSSSISSSSISSGSISSSSSSSIISSSSIRSSSSDWKDYLNTEQVPDTSHAVSPESSSWMLTEEARMPQDSPDTTLRQGDASPSMSHTAVHTDSTYTSTTISRTLLSVTSSSSNSTSSTAFTEDSNSQKPPSTWAVPALATETEDYTHSAPSARTDHRDTTDQDITHSFRGMFSETGTPGGSERTQSYDEQRGATRHQHSSTSEETSDSTPTLRVTEPGTDHQSEVSVSSTPPITSPPEGPANISGTDQDFASSVGTSTESSTGVHIFSTRNQESTGGVSSQASEPSLGQTLTTGPPTASSTSALDHSLTDASVLVTEVFLSTASATVTERPHVTEENMSAASTSTSTTTTTSTTATTATPRSLLPSTSSSRFRGISSSTVPSSSTEATILYTPPSTTASTQALQTTAAHPTHRMSSSQTQRPSTRVVIPTKVTTLQTDTSTVGLTTAQSQHITTTDARNTPTRSTEFLQTTQKHSDRGTTERVVTASPTDTRSTKTLLPRNPCASNPCLNGGMCMSNEGHQFTCICQDAWTGQTCSHDVDECENDPCPSGSRCVNTRGSFSCECPLGFDLADGRTCTRAKTFLGTFSINRLPHDPIHFKSTTVHEIQREIVQLLNASLSALQGYSRSLLSKREEDGLRISAVNMFFLSADVTSAEVYNSIQMFLSNCSSSLAHCRVVLHHQLTYHAESLCSAQKTQCDTERSTCTDSSGTAQCQCHQGYYKHNPDDLSCLDCGDGYKLENGSCVPCTFGFGGFNCGNFYKLIAVVVSPAGGALLLIMIIALIVTCCKKDKNDINKIIFKSGDLQMSPYADFPKSNRISMEWGRETIEMQENGSTKNLLQMTDIYYSPVLRNSDLDRNGLYPFTGLPGSRHSCIYPAQWNPSFISDDSRRRDYF